MSESVNDPRTPVTIPLSEQHPLPQGLPDDWRERPLEAQTRYLNDNAGLLRVVTYLSAGMETGARRLDRAAEAAGKTPVHEAAFLGQLDTEGVHTAFEKGNTDHVQVKDMIQPLGSTGDRSHMVETAKAVEKQFGPKLINPALLYGMFGFNAATGRHIGPSARTFEVGTFHAINKAEWSTCLRGLAGVLQMHQAAARQSRRLVRPLLGEDNTSPVVEGKEELFWQSRLAGAGKSFGMAYYLGYRAKSAVVLRETMQEEWGQQNYWRNREIFTAAMNIQTKHMPPQQRPTIQSRVRRPIFRLIGEGNFDAAHSLLKETATTNPRLFSIATQKFLEVELTRPLARGRASS